MALVAVAGGGLAGTEAALALAHCGHDVRLYEMRPQVETPAHRTAVEPPPLPPSDTMLGALYRYLREANPDDFQPMNSNWGLVDPMPDAPRRKLVRRRALAARADASFRSWAAGVGVAPSGDRHLAL
ncbi:MAG: FAD-dependent oxidoreductase [Gemmatimonadetes bacterium]|nr:FAD-dependent oxidoreductase [Gemmatimonadota bacterium]